MSLDSISKKKIDELGLKLLNIVNEKNYLLRNVEENIEFGKTLVGQMKILYDNIEKAQSKMNEEKKKIKEMQGKYSKIDKLNGISSKSASYEDEIILFAECDSMVENQLSIINKESIENINQNIEILIDQISNIVTSRYTRPKKSNVTQSIISKPKSSLEAKPAEKVTGKIRSNISLKDKDKKISISELKINPNDSNKLGMELTKYEKLCEKCNKFNKFALILGCECVLCFDCIKAMERKSKTIVHNTFDASCKKQETIFACPNHHCSINPKILEKIFGGKKLEEDCIVAMKKQLKYGTILNKYYPNICMICKTVIKDERNPAEAVPLCRKHKACTNCFK